MKEWNVTSVEADTSTEVGAMAGEVRQRHIAEGDETQAVSSSDTPQSNLCRPAPENERQRRVGTSALQVPIVSCVSSVFSEHRAAHVQCFVDFQLRDRPFSQNLNNAHIHSAARSSHHISAPSLKVSRILVVETLVHNLVPETTTHG